MNKTKTVTIKAPAAQLDALWNRAYGQGMTMSQWVRVILLTHLATPSKIRKKIKQDGTPYRDGIKKDSFSFRVDVGLYNEIQRAAAQSKVPASRIIRACLALQAEDRPDEN